MDSALAAFSEHGYGMLFLVVFLEAVGFPIPAALALLVAGGASARGSLAFPLAFGGALAAMLAADILMFLLGRYTGWWLLGLLCRLSLNPESCILRSADSFYRRGRTVLLFAKFLPGINTMAPPLAGSMNMRLGQFLGLDALGVALYIGSYLSVGFLFSDALAAITKSYQTFSRILGWVVGAALVAYLVFQVWMWIKARALRSIPRVDPAEAARGLLSGAATIYDVRSHGYYDAKATRIKGSLRLEPHAVHQTPAEMVPGRLVYLYCTCPREATSARVARELIGMGIYAAVIKGGLRGWKKVDLPVELVPAEEISALPVFD
jgi:membrane protein DedA with SNARE-associated domain/rhodanese-related sulfurtransferase